VIAVLVGFGAGLLFGIGLVIARATDPAVVLGFLDVTGAWNPALIGLMAGGAATFGLLYRLARRRGSPIAAPTLWVPNERPLDARLFIGTALFGVGWGLVGLCPGPAVTALFGGNASGRVFVLAMLAGIAVAPQTQRKALEPGDTPRVRNGVPLLPSRGPGAPKVTMQFVNELLDEP
jgi:uncharacterized protein